MTIPQALPELPGYALPPPPSQGTRVILLRHGRSTLNDAGRYQGSSDDSSLTVQGRIASRQVGQYLRHCPIDHLYTSPLQRAQQTVAELLPHLQKRRSPAITILSTLREIDLASWEGLRYGEVKARFPDVYYRWQATPEQFALVQEPGKSGDIQSQSEKSSLIYPVRDVYQRAKAFWTTTLPQHQGETLLVVSHGGTIQALVNTAIGLPMRQHHGIQQTHSGLTVIDFAVPALGSGRLQVMNLTTPVGEPIPKLKAGKQGLRFIVLPCQPETSPQESLAQLLQGQTITACVVEDSPYYHTSRRSLLADHPETVALSVEGADWLLQWQRSLLRSLLQVAPTGLTTVAAICHQTHAESFLREVVGCSLPLLPNALTVLHYPGVEVCPILQTLNSRPISIC